MEIIRPGITLCFYLTLVLILSFVAGIRTSDLDGVRVSARKQKLEELLRVLKSYPTNHHQHEADQSPPVVIKNQTSILAPNSIEYDLYTPLPDNPSKSGSAIEEDTPQIPPPPSPISSYEDFYRIFYGTEEGVNHLRRHYGPEGLKRARAQYRAVAKEMEDLKSANDHFLRIRTKARCKTPVPRLVRVKDYYPNPSKIYLPRCTLLHRCGEIAGCCDSDAYQCVPNSVQEVALYFYKLTVGRNGLGYSKTNKNNIERLVFVNHTSCHCQPINDLPRASSIEHESYPLDGSSPPSQGDINEETHGKKTPSNHRRHHHHQTQSIISKCRECPVPFTSRTYRDGRCGCDCFDRQKPCLKIKRGKHALSEVELRCIESHFCHPPDCEYGKFDISSGYCPRRHDETPRDMVMVHSRSQIASSTPSSLPPRHRWAYE